MRALLFLSALFLASGAMAQGPPGPPPPPDSTSAWRYYPLHLGDAWQYRVDVTPGETPAYTYTLTRRVEADTTVGGRTYAVVQEWARDAPMGVPSPEARRYLARFDTLSGRIATREIGAAAETLAPCSLAEAFPRNPEEPREVTCPGGGLAAVSGSYAETVVIGDETYTLTAKTISRSGAVDVSETYAAGVGLVRSAFEEAGGRTLALVTARIQGTFYGDAPEADFPGVPDTTDAARYYPLAVGDLWQYQACSGVLGTCGDIDRVLIREVVADESVGDTTYSVVQERFYLRSSPEEGYAYTAQTEQRVRFDPASATVRVRTAEGEFVESCPLDADFETTVFSDTCPGVYVSGEHDDSGVKSFILGESERLYQRDVGFLGLTADGGSSTFEDLLVYSRVGGVERGTPVPVVDVADEAEPLATTLTLAAFPNPTAGPLAMEVTGARGVLQLEAFDALGRRVLSREIAPEARVELDASGWAPGVYVLRATSGDQTATARIVRR